MPIAERLKLLCLKLDILILIDTYCKYYQLVKILNLGLKIRMSVVRFCQSGFD